MPGSLSHILAMTLLGTLGVASLARVPVPAGAAAPIVLDVNPPATLAPAPAKRTVPRPPAALILGEATFYAEDFHGQTMADGRRFDMHDPTITASNRWPLGTILRVRRLAGCPWDATLSTAELDHYRAQVITVTVSDRGDFTHELDLSRAAFARLGRLDEGRLLVSIEVLGGGG